MFIFKRPEYDLSVVTVTVLILFGLSTYLLLRRDTIAYFKSFNEDTAADGKKQE